MNFATKSELLRTQVAMRLAMHQAISSQQQHMISNRLMSFEFDKNFYSGDLNSEFKTSPFNPTLHSIFTSFAKGTFFTIYATLSIWIKKKIDDNKSPDCLVYALPEELVTSHASTSELREFLSIQLVNIGQSKPESIFVQSRNKKFDSAKGILCVRDIGIAMLPFCKLGKLAITKKLWKNYGTWLRLSRQNPEILNIGSEFIVDSISFGINKAPTIKYLITTQSVLLCPPIAFHYCQDALKVMIWYSDNSQQIKGNDGQSITNFDYSYLKQKTIDIHLVWTETWAKILRENGETEVRVVGPILFKKLVDLSSSKKTHQKNRKILVFDVTPKKFLSDTSNYYNDRNAREFIEDIMEASKSSKLNFKIDLKPKREYSKSDSKSYLDFLKANSRRIRILSSSQDIVRLVQNYDLVICIPFTSPAIVSKTLGVETIFYNPSTSYQLEHAYEGIHVVSGRQSLINYLHRFG